MLFLLLHPLHFPLPLTSTHPLTPAGTWGELKIIMLSGLSCIQKTKTTVFFHMWRIDPKDKCIYKHDHVYIDMWRKKERERENMSVTMGLFERTRKRRGTISKYISSV
jgi:hypothetical protein